MGWSIDAGRETLYGPRVYLEYRRLAKSNLSLHSRETFPRLSAGRPDEWVD
jgi:hypothetical protein